MEKLENLGRENLQPPFKERDLLSLNSFISYCYKYGVSTDRKELEYFEKENLLLPAIRVNRGVVEYREVLADYDGRGSEEWRNIPLAHLDQAKKEYRIKQVGDKIYSHGSFWRTKGWIDSYIQKKMVIFPARVKFKAWSEYDSSLTWASSPEKLGFSYETFYSKYQLYPLKFIKERRSFIFKNAGLFRSSESWIEAGKVIKDIFTKEQGNEFITEKILDYYRLFKLLIDIESLWEKKEKKLEEFFKVALKENDNNREEAIKDLKHYESEEIDQLKSKAREILKKHRLSFDYIENWRLTFLSFGTFGLKVKIFTLRKPYLTLIDEDTLANTEEPYKIVYLLNWFIDLCGGKKTTIKELILGFGGKFCPYCRNPFNSIRKTQISCGKPYCKKAHEYKLKREGRKSGKYIN